MTVLKRKPQTQNEVTCAEAHDTKPSLIIWLNLFQLAREWSIWKLLVNTNKVICRVSQRYIHLAFVYGHVFILNAFILKIFSCWVKISRLTNFLLLVLLQQLSLHCLLTSVTSSGESSVILIFPLFAALLIYFFPVTRFYKFDCYVSWYGSL